MFPPFILSAPARDQRTGDDTDQLIPANHLSFATATHRVRSPISQRKMQAGGVHLHQESLDADKLPALDGIWRGNHMDWFYWDTAWSLFFSLVWFMTIMHNPDARVADGHLRDEAFGG